MKFASVFGLLSLAAGIAQAAPITARTALAEPIIDLNLSPLPVKASLDILDLDLAPEKKENAVIQQRDPRFIVGSKPLPAAQIPKFWDFVKSKVKSIAKGGSSKREAEAAPAEMGGIAKREARFIVGSKPLPAAQIPKFGTFLKNKIKGLFGKGA